MFDFTGESKFKIIKIINICVPVYSSQNAVIHGTSSEPHKSQPIWERVMETELQKVRKLLSGRSRT